MTDADRRLAAATGALEGACVGDAAGAVLEFLGREPRAADVARALSFPGGGCWGVAPGQITDDGELTLALASALTAGGFDVERIAAAYAGWYGSRPFDIGQTTARAFGVVSSGRMRDGVSLASAMRAAAHEGSLGSKANGSLMRATPLGVVGQGRPPDAVAALAIADSSLSHPNASCCDAVACYAIAIASLVEVPGDRARAWSRAHDWAARHARAEARDWLAAAERGEEAAFTPQDGFVRIGFVNAFVHLRRGSTYAAALESTLAGGGDTDTNACIVGGLIGAASPEQIPAAWLEAVRGSDSARGRPRPAVYHPARIPELVRAILAAAD